MSPLIQSRHGWLFGPVPDLLFGCGIGYAVLVLLLFICQPDMARLAPWLPLVILVTGVPHYGATLLRVYATSADRRRYARHAFLWSAPILCAFVASLSVPRLGAWLITLYLSLSPWHYAAQNWGLTLLFLRRRGVPVSAAARRLLRASFIASYALVLISYHRASGSGSSDPLYAASAAFRFLPLGLPMRLAQVATPLLFGVYAGTLALGVRLLLQKSRPRALTPAAALLVSQALWFALPALASQFLPGRYPGQQAALAFIWVALGHCVQYLWISTYYRRAAGAAASAAASLAYLLRVLLLGAAVWTLPALIFAPGALGRVPFDAGLGLLIAAAVNLHHFVLDSAIWRLRDPRVGALLVHAPLASPTPDRRQGPPSLAGCVLITIGGLATLAWIVVTWEKEVGYRRAYAAGDVARLERASERLAALGRDGPQIHVALGKLKAQKGQTAEAVAEFQRSLRLWPSAAAWFALGRLQQSGGNRAAAAAAYQSALTLSPDHAAARRSLAQVQPGLLDSAPTPR